jgi:hypothetical protein
MFVFFLFFGLRLSVRADTDISRPLFCRAFVSLHSGSLLGDDSFLDQDTLGRDASPFSNFPGVFAGDVDGTPHVPAGDGAVGAPSLAELGELFGLRDAALAVGKGETFLDTVVVDGEYVRAAQAEDQEHFYGPWAYATHGDKALDQFLVGHLFGVGKCGNDACDCFLREVADGGDFRAREARFAQGLVPHTQKYFGGGAAAVSAQGLDASEDYGRRFSGDALIGDSAEEGFVGSLLVVDTQLKFYGFLDEGGEVRVVLGDVGDGFAVIERVQGFSGHGCAQDTVRGGSRATLFDRTCLTAPESLLICSGSSTRSLGARISFSDTSALASCELVYHRAETPPPMGIEGPVFLKESRCLAATKGCSNAT